MRDRRAIRRRRLGAGQRGGQKEQQSEKKLHVPHGCQGRMNGR
jgi:hypothetical protein